MATTITEAEIKIGDVNYLVEIEVEAKLVDDSFSHEFGIESASGVEAVGIEVITVYDQDGIVITNREIIKQIERSLDANDFLDRFEGYEFNDDFY